MANSKCNNSIDWVDLFLRDIVAGLGIIANILIVVILLQRHLRTTFNKLRVALAVSDATMLTTCLAASLLRSSRDILGTMYIYILWPLRNFALTTSIFMTVAIALERFLAINDPHSYRRNKRYRTTKYVSFATIAAVLLNMGKFFELDQTECDHPRALQGLFFGVVKAWKSMAENKMYGMYNTVLLKILITGLIPIALLIGLYLKIYFKVRSHQLHQPSVNKVKKRLVREQKSAGIFAGVVITSLICTVPDMAVKVQLLIYGLTEEVEDHRPSSHDATLLQVRDIFAVLNAAINFVIYAWLGKAFRKEFKKFFRNAFNCGERSTSLTMTENPNTKSNLKHSYTTNITESSV